MDQKRPDDRQPSFTPGQLQSVLGTQEGKRLLQLLNRDGDAALLYLALLRHHGTVQPRSLAGELRWEKSRI